MKVRTRCLTLLDSLARSTRGATATTYIIVLGCVALVGLLAFSELRKEVESTAKAEAFQVATAFGSENDGPSGSLYAEVSAAGVEEALVSAPWAMGAKGAKHGAVAAYRQRRAHSSDEFENKRAAGDAPAHDTNGDTPRCNGASCNTRGACFAAGTPISTPDGLRLIESLRVGDEVLSRDESTGNVFVERIETTTTTPDMPVLGVEVQTQDPAVRESVFATPGHFFWTDERGWSRADELVPGDQLMDATGKHSYVLDTFVAGVEVVYNIDVANHSHFVGEAAVWTRNPLGRRQ
ncbi:MAG TPA: Hint domain-containing protein [Polyangiaceae bacterium]